MCTKRKIILEWKRKALSILQTKTLLIQILTTSCSFLATEKEFQKGEEKRYLKKTYRRAKNPHGQRKQEQTKMGPNIHNSRKTTQNKEGEELKTP